MRKRTRARQFALEVLYQVDLLGRKVLDDSLADMAERAGEPDVSEFAASLVRGTLENLPEIDPVIREVAENWDLSRMATIDRNVLRLGAYELLHRDDIPPKVSINEAIELGKQYSTAESGTFVNGILDRIKNSFGPPGKREAGPAGGASSGEADAPGETPGDSTGGSEP
jgi:transcription antitermination factor NusB